MLVTKRSAGVATEVNLRNPLVEGNEARKPGIHPGFKTLERSLEVSRKGLLSHWHSKSSACQKHIIFWRDCEKLKLSCFTSFIICRIMWYNKMYKEEIFSETSVHKFLVNMSSCTLILIICYDIKWGITGRARLIRTRLIRSSTNSK